MVALPEWIAQQKQKLAAIQPADGNVSDLSTDSDMEDDGIKIAPPPKAVLEARGRGRGRGKLAKQRPSVSFAVSPASCCGWKTCRKSAVGRGL